jgi:hypothetical protein
MFGENAAVGQLLVAQCWKTMRLATNCFAAAATVAARQVDQHAHAVNGRGVRVPGGVRVRYPGAREAEHADLMKEPTSIDVHANCP